MENEKKVERIEHEKKVESARLVRILQKDISGEKKVYPGLTNIKGICWAFSGAICKKLKINKNKTIQELTEKEIEGITEFVKHPSLPKFLLNRRKDIDTGNDEHLHGSDLTLRHEFDIKRLKKIKSYRGTRHANGLPVRGQRTKSHFRKNRKKSGAAASKNK